MFVDGNVGWHVVDLHLEFCISVWGPLGALYMYTILKVDVVDIPNSMPIYEQYHSEGF